jgi:CheY-like chemotaxis protein
VASSPLVLVVDDDPDIREALIDVLSDHGYEAKAAANGREALNLLRAGKRPRVILLDLMMPVMDGVQFRQEQLQHPELRDLPVILISAGNDVAQIAEQLGVSISLRKPIDLDVLLEQIARCAHR